MEIVFFYVFGLSDSLELCRGSHFCTKSLFSCPVLMGVVGSFEDEICTSEYVPQLN